MRWVLTTLLVGLGTLGFLASISVAEDTAKQTEEAATRELQSALQTHRKLSREAALLERQIEDLRGRKLIAEQRLREAKERP